MRQIVAGAHQAVWIVVSVSRVGVQVGQCRFGQWFTSSDVVQFFLIDNRTMRRLVGAWFCFLLHAK